MFTLTPQDVYLRAVELLEEKGHEASFREGYSGRAMYGKTVPAIVTGAPATLVGAAIVQATAELISEAVDDGRLEPDEAIALVEPMDFVPARQDSMGRDDRVYY